MATYTNNLNLIKPAQNDLVSIDDINSNMDILDALGIDYIVEKGSSDGWDYIHYAGGIAMAWRRITLTGVTFDAAGNIYRSPTQTVSVASGIFNAAPPTVLVTSGSSSVICGAVFHSNTATSIEGRLFKVNANRSDVLLQFLAIGTWK